MSESFKTEVDVELRGKTPIKLGDIERTNRVWIIWEVDFEMRTWGIKGMSIFVPTQEIWISGSHVPYEEPNGDAEDFEFLAKLDGIKGNFEMINETLAPDTLYLEWNEKTNTFTGELE